MGLEESPGGSMVKPDDNLHQRLLTARLPALPQVLLRFLELSRRDDSDFDEIGRLIAQEPAMAAKVLNLAGSASRYRSQPPRDLFQSLLHLGLDTVKTALVAEAVHQVFDAFVAGRSVDLGHFWRHSLAAAILAKRLAVKTGYSRPEEAYLAGLLHDVGQLALVATLPEQYAKAFSEHHDDAWLANWEGLTLGLTHAEVGAWLAGRWQLDSYLADALLYHHEPAEHIVTAHPLVRIAWLAHALDHKQEFDSTAFGLDAETLAWVQEGVDVETEQAARFLEVDLGGEEGDAAARARLVEEVRPLALAGAQGEAKFRPGGDLLPRLQATMMAARSLYGLGDGILYQPERGHLQGRVAWLHLTRLEELVIPLGAGGGCVGTAAASARIATSWDDDRPAVILDDQLRRGLEGEGLLCVPLGKTAPCAVLAFALERDKAKALLARPLLLENFAAELAAGLGLAAPAREDDANLHERLRRAVHEANNPLGIIKNYLHVLGERLAGQEEAADIALLSAEIDRVGRILRGLTAPETGAAESPAGGADLNRAVQELVGFVRDTGFIPPGIQLEVALADELPRVRATTDSLKQILLNLLKNAVEALSDKGRISIVSAGPVLHEGRRHVVLSVSDDGPGLSEGVRARLFQPVETQKGGEHAGLGLAVVGELVQKMQGRIECQSGGLGTRFEVLLPSVGNGAALV